MNPDLAQSLHPPRLPEAFAQLGFEDILASFGLGLLAAALILTLAGPWLVPRPRRPSLSRRLNDLARLPAPEQMLALAQLLAEQGRPVPAAAQAALYQAGPISEEHLALMRQAAREGR